MRKSTNIETIGNEYFSRLKIDYICGALHGENDNSGGGSFGGDADDDDDNGKERLWRQLVIKGFSLGLKS